MLPSDKLRRDILKQYDEQPRGWHILTAKDSRGYLDTIVVHGQDVWFLKEERISPYQVVGFGIQYTAKESVKRLPGYTFGFRPLSRRLLASFEGAVSQGRQLDEVIMRALRTRPAPWSQITSPVTLQGPVFHLEKTPLLMPAQQKDFDAQLRQEVDRLLLRKYPHLKTMYG